MASLPDVCRRLDEHQFQYHVIELGGAHRIIVTRYGGRIFGPFSSDGESYCWINPVLSDKREFDRFLSNREWNLGGDRIWLAPELQFNVPDHTDFWGSYKVPEALDPGHYVLHRDQYGNSVLSQTADLDVFGGAGTRKSLSIERTIRPAANPLNEMDAIFFGYHHDICLKEQKKDGVVCEAWDLLQILPEGTIYIPTTQKIEPIEYYEPFRKGYQKILPNHIELKIDAKCRYKAGYKAVHTTGRSGYLSRLGGISYLLVRCFYSDPSAPYTKAPVDRPEHSGSALHIYNDDGSIGSFAEHECSGRPIGGDTGRSESSDTISTYYFIGRPEVLS
ncbi:MAG: hypothetical protein HN368_01805, partial [Spirochaetales bacterium]|nr:hypothetical protein [Spirochaetales bacterium]